MSNPNRGNSDVNQAWNRAFDEEDDSFRVKVTGQEISVDSSMIANAVKEGLSNIRIEQPQAAEKTTIIERIEVPVIVKEQEIVQVERQVIVKETEIQHIEVPVVSQTIQVVEVPMVIKEIEVREIQVPVIIQQKQNIDRVLTVLQILVTLAVGLLVFFSKK